MKKHNYQLLFCLSFLFINFYAQAENTLGNTLAFNHIGNNIFNVKTSIYVDKSVNRTSPNFYQGFIPGKIYSKGTKATCDLLVKTIPLNLPSKGNDFPYAKQECAGSFSISTTKIVYSSNLTLNNSALNNLNGYYLACPKPKIFLSGSDSTIHEISAVICEGSFRILETVNNASFTYVWKKNGVLVAGANKYQLKVLYKDAGKYTVAVTGTGTCSGVETSLETELRPQSGENVKLTVTDSTVCSNSVPVILEIEQISTGTARSSFKKEWYINETIIAGAGGKQFYPVSVSGKYKVVVTDFTTGSSKCTYEAFKEIVVTPIPNPTITNLTGKTAVCQGDIVKLSVVPVETNVTYHWVRNSVDIASTPSLDVNATGTYTIRAESTLNTDCFNYAPAPINIAVNPYPTVTFDDIKPVCNTNSGKVDLRNFVSPYAPTLGVFSGTGVRGYEFDPTISGYGSFPIKYTYTTLVGCQKEASKTAVVDLSPTVKLGNDITIFRGDTIRLKSVGSKGSNYLYEWTPATSLNSPNIPQPIANPDVTTEYTVKVSSILGKCTATDKILITVKSTLKIPAAFTPNSDTINDTWAIMDNNREFNDYPDIEVKIFNRWGGEIFYSIGSGAYQTKPFDGIQDGQRLPAGTYFYVIKPSPDVPSLTGYVTIVR